MPEDSLEKEQDFQRPRWRPYDLPLSELSIFRHGQTNAEQTGHFEPVISPARAVQPNCEVELSPMSSPSEPLAKCCCSKESNRPGPEPHTDVSSAASPESPNEYKKRPRRKTREDRYESKKSKSSNKGSKDKTKPTTRKGSAHPLRSSKEILSSFKSPSVSSDKVTMKPNFVAGLFTNGRTSRIAELSDLDFNEMEFLRTNLLRGGEKFNEAATSRHTRRRDKELQADSELFDSMRPDKLRARNVTDGSRSPRRSHERNRSSRSSTPVRPQNRMILCPSPVRILPSKRHQSRLEQQTRESHSDSSAFSGDGQAWRHSHKLLLGLIRESLQNSDVKDLLATGVLNVPQAHAEAMQEPSQTQNAPESGRSNRHTTEQPKYQDKGVMVSPRFSREEGACSSAPNELVSRPKVADSDPHSASIATKITLQDAPRYASTCNVTSASRLRQYQDSNTMVEAAPIEPRPRSSFGIRVEPASGRDGEASASFVHPSGYGDSLQSSSTIRHPSQSLNTYRDLPTHSYRYYNNNFARASPDVALSTSKDEVIGQDELADWYGISNGGIREYMAQHRLEDPLHQTFDESPMPAIHGANSFERRNLHGRAIRQEQHHRYADWSAEPQFMPQHLQYHSLHQSRPWSAGPWSRGHHDASDSFLSHGSQRRASGDLDDDDMVSFWEPNRLLQRR